jgi:cobalamin biosynthesis protein CbiG
MDLNSQPIGIYIRIIAIVSLLLGLNDASRLLGVNLGAVSPLTTMGMTGFVYLGIFALARLFAAVGLWIKASWGAVLLIGATGAEMVLYLIGSADVSMSAIGFAVRIVLLVSMLIVLVLNVRLQRARSID